VATCVLALLIAVGPGASAQSPQGAEAQVERLLAAVGGRERWAALTSTTNVSKQNRATDPAVIVSTIWLDFRAPRFRIENRGEQFHSWRAVTNGQGWVRRNDGTIGDISPTTLNEDVRWYGAHVYRSLHRMAARDAALTYRVGSADRLEVYEHGRRMIWFRLDPRGEPFVFGQWEDETGTICGPWEVMVDGVRHPIWTSTSDGTWRARLQSLELDTPYRDADFRRPASR
jgi:hypothetical protein